MNILRYLVSAASITMAIALTLWLRRQKDCPAFGNCWGPEDIGTAYMKGQYGQADETG